MNIIAADDEQLALEELVESIQEAEPDAHVYSFKKTSEVLEFVKNIKCDIVFLDIEMRGMKGTELAKKLKDIIPDLNIIFVTGYSEYILDAFSLHASGYILKPPTKEDIEREILNLRNPIAKQNNGEISIVTFGKFDVLVRNEPVSFKRKKSKEILAYLVDRKGASATKAEIAGILFPDKEYDGSVQKQVQVYISDMCSSLRNAGAGDIIIKSFNNISVDINKFQCDYYDFLKMEPWAVNSYKGEYMIEYEWAEFTTEWINNKL